MNLYMLFQIRILFVRKPTVQTFVRPFSLKIQICDKNFITARKRSQVTVIFSQIDFVEKRS